MPIMQLFQMVGQAQCQCEKCESGVRPSAARKYRSAANPEIFEANHFAFGIHDSVAILAILGTHAASTDMVVTSIWVIQSQYWRVMRLVPLPESVCGLPRIRPT